VSSTCRVATFAHIGDDYADSPIQVTGEEFEVSQFVFVKKEAEDHDTPNAIPYWIAKVLEVRAGDAQHVYLRIYWAYRPEDLPGGRQPHHGDCELIVSNHMDVIDALCVQGAANVVHWDDYPDSLTFPAPEQLYWRQSLDITKRKGSQLTVRFLPVGHPLSASLNMHRNSTPIASTKNPAIQTNGSYNAHPALAISMRTA